jgi:predicted nuclease of predicted toxin-antitoxin system
VRFLVDTQLPPALARCLARLGHEAVHTSEVGLEAALDADVWSKAIADGSIVVSKDEDFFHLANRPADRGRLLWIRIGNCRKVVLVDAIERTSATIVAAFESGQRIVELT